VAVCLLLSVHRAVIFVIAQLSCLLTVSLKINYYLIMYWTDLHQIFKTGRSMGGHDRSDIRFVISQGTLLWQAIL